MKHLVSPLHKDERSFHSALKVVNHFSKNFYCPVEQREESVYRILPKSVRKYGHYCYKFIQNLTLIIIVIEPIFTQLAFPCQLLVKIAYAEIHERFCG